MDLSIEENVLYAAIIAAVICVIANHLVSIYRISKQKKFDADFAKFLANLKKYECVPDNA